DSPRGADDNNTAIVVVVDQSEKINSIVESPQSPTEIVNKNISRQETPSPVEVTASSPALIRRLFGASITTDDDSSIMPGDQADGCTTPSTSTTTTTTTTTTSEGHDEQVVVVETKKYHRQSFKTPTVAIAPFVAIATFFDQHELQLQQQGTLGTNNASLSSLNDASSPSPSSSPASSSSPSSTVTGTDLDSIDRATTDAVEDHPRASSSSLPPSSPASSITSSSVSQPLSAHQAFSRIMEQHGSRRRPSLGSRLANALVSTQLQGILGGGAKQNKDETPIRVSSIESFPEHTSSSNEKMQYLKDFFKKPFFTFKP
ncbi:hypothetical protein BGZ65_006827, partial [Modicella reniformis]